MEQLDFGQKHWRRARAVIAATLFRYVRLLDRLDGSGVARNQQCSGQGGFTLVELMVVITILGVLIGISVPRLRGSYEGARLSSAAESMSRAVLRARETAIATGSVVDLTWDPLKSLFSVRRSMPERLETGDSSLENDPLGFERKVPNDFLVQVSRPAIRFYPNATSEDASIELQDSRGRFVRVRIDGETAQPVREADD